DSDAGGGRAGAFDRRPAQPQLYAARRQHRVRPRRPFGPLACVRVVEPEHPAVLVELRPERLPGMAVVALAETEVDRADVVPAVRVGARGDEPLDLSGVGGAARRV